MQGSKYSDDVREKALAMCAMPKMNAAKVAAAMGIPRATVYDWQKTALENDSDYVAVRRNKIRAMMDKSYAVVGRAIDGLDAQSKALKLEKTQIDKILLKILSDDELDENTREKMAEIVRAYTGASMTDVSKVARETLDMYDRLESRLSGESNETSEVHVQLTLVDPAEGKA